MINIARRMSLSAFFAAAFLAFLPVSLASGSTAALADDDFGKSAEQFVQSLADEAIKSLAAEGLEQQERVERFKSLLHKHFDVEAIGRWVLGRYWRKASKEQRAEYMKLFEGLIIATYVNQFTGLSGEQLQVTQAITNEQKKDAIVRSEILRPKGQPPIKVDWRVRAPEGKFKIVDVVVEGVSMSQTQRSEFGSVIKREGGNLDGLLAALRKKTETLYPTKPES